MCIHVGGVGEREREPVLYLCLEKGDIDREKESEGPSRHLVCRLTTKLLLKIARARARGFGYTPFAFSAR